MTADPLPELPIDPDRESQADIFREGAAAARRWDIALVVAAGGAIGGGCRYLLNIAWSTTPGTFPWSTFVENVSGCLLLGALMVFLLDVWRPSRYGRPFLGVGVLGGYTTFSTNTSETDALLRAGEVPLALAYLFGSLAVGLLATWIGLTVARSIAGLDRETGRTA